MYNFILFFIFMLWLSGDGMLTNDVLCFFCCGFADRLLQVPQQPQMQVRRLIPSTPSAAASRQDCRYVWGRRYGRIAAQLCEDRCHADGDL